ncbi:segregation and condensation protein A [Thermincola ferriacetica]|uniref:segregation and condensation protein A n=1 Tax=Thermincola ferriacetica TaxID=281456 RepID=UPI0031F4210B
MNLLAYQIKLPVFEGPFDLLFHLIEKNEVDIYDIPIATITEQYLEYLAQMQMLDLEIASEFLVMAARLLHIKARMLLPKPPREPADDEEEVELEDPRDELVERLLEYKKFKQVADFLKQREEEQEKIYVRPNEEEMFIHLFSEENPLEGIDLSKLLKALKEVFQRAEQVETTGEIPRDEVSIRDKMREIRRRLFFLPRGISFKDLLASQASKVEIIVTFLALLELIKLKQVKVSQPKVFGEIMIFSCFDTLEPDEWDADAEGSDLN